MGLDGTDVAHEAADMGLTGDSFATIIRAVEQGYTTHITCTFITDIMASRVPEVLPFVAMVALNALSALIAWQILTIDLGIGMVLALNLEAQAAAVGTPFTCRLEKISLWKRELFSIPQSGPASRLN